MGRRLARTGFVRRAIDDRADLQAFTEPFTLRIGVGLLALTLSFVISWPAIVALGALAVYVRRPWLAAVGGPVLYGLSHVLFILGMALCGAKYGHIFLRWATRTGVERLMRDDPD